MATKKKAPAKKKPGLKKVKDVSAPKHIWAVLMGETGGVSMFESQSEAEAFFSPTVSGDIGIFRYDLGQEVTPK